MSLRLYKSKLVKIDGTAMEPDEVQKSLMLIKLLDNQFSRPPRSPVEYSQRLMRAALAVLQKHSETMVAGVCHWIGSRRQVANARMPANTEAALRDFDDLAQRFARVGIRIRAKELRRRYETKRETPAAAA